MTRKNIRAVGVAVLVVLGTGCGSELAGKPREAVAEVELARGCGAAAAPREEPVRPRAPVVAMCR